MIFKKQAEEDFDIQAAEFPEMESLINRCANIYRGVPEWLDDKNNIKTINFAKSVCSETARLATLAIGIQIDGSARATWLQEQIDKVYFQIRHWVEYGCAYGTVFIKPFSKFKEWDPEMGSTNGQQYPLSKTFTLGLTVNI